MDFRSLLALFALLAHPTTPTAAVQGSFQRVFGNMPLFGTWFGASVTDKEKMLTIPVIKRENVFEGRVFIGSGKETYHLIFGSSFSGMWVFSKTACDAAEDKAKFNDIHLYDDHALTDEQKKQTFTLDYLDGVVSGYIIKESITIGGQTITNQDLGVVTKWSENLVGNFDGYFGIQFIDEKNERTVGHPFFHTLLEQNIISQLVYGVYLNLPRGEGQVSLGGVKEKLMQGEPKSVQVTQYEGVVGWYLQVDRINFGTTVMDDKPLKVLVDPCNSNIAGSPAVITAINEKIGAKPMEGAVKIYTLDCGTIDNLPNIEFDFGGTKFELKPSEYTWQMRFWIGPRVCFSYFFPHDSISEYDIVLGAPFLTKYYSRFDVEKKTISFTNAILNPNTLSWLFS